MIVIDTSVAVKLIFHEEKSEIAKQLLIFHIKGVEQIIVPHFLFIEVANVLATKTKFATPDIKRGLEFLYNSNFLIHEITQADLIYASILAKEHKTSVYDMIYAVIAKNKKIKLVTADDKFVKKVGWPFVQSLKQLAPK